MRRIVRSVIALMVFSLWAIAFLWIANLNLMGEVKPPRLQPVPALVQAIAADRRVSGFIQRSAVSEMDYKTLLMVYASGFTDGYADGLGAQLFREAR